MYSAEAPPPTCDQPTTWLHQSLIMSYFSVSDYSAAVRSVASSLSPDHKVQVLGLRVRYL